MKLSSSRQESMPPRACDGHGLPFREVRYHQYSTVAFTLNQDRMIIQRWLVTLDRLKVLHEVGPHRSRSVECCEQVCDVRTSTCRRNDSCNNHAIPNNVKGL